jgi:tetratricopeptide (TPR) repeat protein
MTMRALPFLIFGLLLSAPARADWYQASSPHFLIYSDDRPEKIRDFALKLERFDQAVRKLRTMPELPPSNGNRVTIFVVRDEKAVRALAKDTTGFINGFYRASAEGSVAFVPRELENSNSADDINLVFLHEYSHHLMMQQLETPYPEWLIEGFAEFMASARFERNGAIALGLSAKHRAYSLNEGPSLPLETLLSGKYDKITVGERESIYGRGWLMTHFFVFDAARKGQLSAYLAGIARGVDALEAARSAFGDLTVLGRDLERYRRQSRLAAFRIPPEMLKTPSVEVTPLSPGAVAVMPFLVELKNGASREEVEKFIPQLRSMASQFAGDLLAETTLADAELALEKFDAAEAATDRALKTNPQSTDAMILKGRAIMERARKSEDFDPKSFVPARQWFIKANKIDPEDPEPLMHFYLSYLLAGERPNANAIAALHYASNLAPQDPGLRLNSALQYLRDGKLKEARLTLAPIAYDPHGKDIAATARAMIAKIDAGDGKGAEAAVAK